MKWWQALITHIVAVLCGFGAGWLWFRKKAMNGTTNPNLPADPMQQPGVQSVLA
jgi:F0F1-type ATP synthase assembly protein I